LKYMKQVAGAGIILLFGLGTSNSYSQVEPDSLQAWLSDAPRVFLDCNRCDHDYIQTEITFVNYVRDRKQAQVHVLVTTQRTGSGGREYTLTFIGREKFIGMADTLKFVSGNTDTGNDIRQGYVTTLKLGLVRFAAKTPVAKQISISHQKQEVGPAEVKDKWNHWVFRISARGFFSGQKQSSSLSIGGSFSASHVTDNWKIRLSPRADYSRRSFTIDDETQSLPDHSYGFASTFVRSINEHWSVGSFQGASSSTFSNTKLQVAFTPAFEYNLFPYSESTRRELRFLYRIGARKIQYRKETVFDKTEETLLGHELSVTLETTQTWGSIEFSLEGSNFFHDFSKNRLTFFAELEMRLFKGFSLTLVGSYSRIRDQLSLTKGDAETEDVLLLRRELATSFEYFSFVRLSYTFGSIFSSVVNSRFGNSRN